MCLGALRRLRMGGFEKMPRGDQSSVVNTYANAYIDPYQYDTIHLVA